MPEFFKHNNSPNFRQVGIGSEFLICGVSEFCALPLVRVLTKEGPLFVRLLGMMTQGPTFQGLT
ncbi:hypothetical protein Hanom_Chr16g01445821 [Helianthus anomalus]